MGHEGLAVVGRHATDVRSDVFLYGVHIVSMLGNGFVAQSGEQFDSAIVEGESFINHLLKLPETVLHS